MQWTWGLDDDPRPRRRPGRRRHAAGDGEPARRHGRAARDAAGRARRGDRVDRRDRRRPRSSRRRRNGATVGGADHRDGHRAATSAAASSAASRSRSTAARPGTRRPGASTLDLHAGRPRRSARSRSARRAVDDSGNLESAGRGRHRRRRRPQTCPCTHLERPARSPANADETDSQRGRARRQVPHRRRRLHHRRSASTRAPATPARTSGTCGRAAGTLLAPATFTGETATRLAAGDVRHAGRGHGEHDLRRVLHAPNGHYAFDAGYFARPASTARRCTRSRTAGRPERRVPLGRPRRFPTDSLQATNYWVDVVFEDRRTLAPAPLLTPRVRATRSLSVPTGPQRTPAGRVETRREVQRAAWHGEIGALRFYKGAQHRAPTSGSLWTTAGTCSPTATFSRRDAASGWQEVALARAGRDRGQHDLRRVVPLADVGFYAVQTGVASSRADQRAAPARCCGRRRTAANGVLRLRRERLPGQRRQRRTSYWVDVGVRTRRAVRRHPADGHRPSRRSGDASVAVGSERDGDRSARRWTPRRSPARPFQLRDAVERAGPGELQLRRGHAHGDARPDRPRSPTPRTYTATVHGGAGGVHDAAGNPLAADVTWSFTTAAPPPPGPDVGPGGPILLVTSTANPFTRYYAEILRTEGLNAFATIDIAALDAGRARRARARRARRDDRSRRRR